MTLNHDAESGERLAQHTDFSEPLIQPKGKTTAIAVGGDHSGSRNDGSISMVLISTSVAVCGSFEFGTCVGYSSPTQSGIRKDLGLSLTEYSVFGSILTVGAMIGAITSGKIADSVGRKGAMRVSAIFCILGWLAIYFSRGAFTLDLGRISTGYGMGVFSYVVPVFIAEITPKNLRGGLTTVNQLMICCGASTGFILGIVLTWRTLALVGLLPCILVLLGLFVVPESPRWLAKVGRGKEFNAALRRLRGNEADISSEAAEIQEYIQTLEVLPESTVMDLFQKRYSHSVIVGVGLMIFQQFGGINGIGFYTRETLELAGFSGGNGTAIIGYIQPPINLLGAILMDKCGRKPLIMFSATGTCLGSVLTGVAFYLQEHEMVIDWVPELVFAGLLVYFASFSTGMGAVPWVIMSEIFPINVKGTAGSLATAVNWFGSWVASYTFIFLTNWSQSGTFFLYAGVYAAAVVFVAILVPETKGKTLEEIQASMNSSKNIENIH
ncbi:sugar transporter ERD6-like 7 isoform X2 [Aristolochia californica]|uniref:sugar transporter ERD6-like 7 isoform X2 n=1 Tax=Aristolochia californica TaxID=171875 RepID=UPI0035DCB02E